MSNKLLVALDGSECGRRALNAAVAHASKTGSDLVLTYVIEWTPYSFHTPEELAEPSTQCQRAVNRQPGFCSDLFPDLILISDFCCRRYWKLVVVA
jgi:nucleotide-binding universal stress UspA family protein